jgi:FkbM family methyltransferase
MKYSHTALLVEEAFEKVQEFNYKRDLNELEDVSQNPSRISPSGGKHVINRILEKLGLHLMYKSVLEELQNYFYSKMGKWSSVGTLQLVLKNPEKFDEVYNMLADEDSRVTFDWFIKYRVAYAFLGELAGAIYPPKITKTYFFKGMNNLKFNRHNLLISTQNFGFKSEALETAQTWVFEQYNLGEKRSLSKGDYVIDGGALKGETSFWFISEGAEKVYAFEPDPYSFSILSENVERNKSSNKIIPVQKILSNRIGSYSLYTIMGGGSAVLEGGNETVEGVTLDSFVEKEGLNRLDFIKLDVEGAEMEVLEGAVETIKKFKPKMAISVYHKPEDVITIPKFILQVLPKAKFYLSHKSSYELYETILFVNPRSERE